eukprot:6567722-Pyramimonas_sp.AAC.2
MRGYIPITDQSDIGSVGIFPRRTNQTEAHRHVGPVDSLPEAVGVDDRLPEQVAVVSDGGEH